MIDTQLTEQGVRYPVYQWTGGIGKIEEFLSGRTDFDDDTEISSFQNKTLRHAVIQRLAILHSAGSLMGFWSGYNPVEPCFLNHKMPSS